MVGYAINDNSDPLGEVDLRIKTYDFFRKVPKDSLLNRIKFNRIAKSMCRKHPEAYSSWKEPAKVLKRGGIPVKWEMTSEILIDNSL